MMDELTAHGYRHTPDALYLMLYIMGGDGYVRSAPVFARKRRGDD